MPADPRRAVGALGERLAETHLARSGYRMLDRNFRTQAGELDLVATGAGCIVFCEVRARIATAGAVPGEQAGPLESIGPEKRRRLRRMAREWLATRPAGARGDSGCESLRFDAIGVLVDSEGALLSLEHVEDAF